MIEARRRRLLERMAFAGLDAFLSRHLIHVRYLTGFSGSNGAVVVSPERLILATDGRYSTQAAQEAPLADLLVGRDLVAGSLERSALPPGSRVGIEPSHLTVFELEELTAATAERGLELISTSNLVEDLRLIKDESELTAIEVACQITSAAWEQLISEGVAGRTEVDLAGRIEHLFRLHGAEDRAFETIVASGPNSAIPHHQPTTRVVQAGDLLKIDCGARVSGYHADMTRTVAVGPASVWQREIHEIVLAAQKAGRQALVAGASPVAVDQAARQVVEAAGFGPNFVHPTGHAVGLEIHERPFLGREDAILAPCMAVTVEPGIYLPERGGVRIEDTVLISTTGQRDLTTATRELLEI